MKLLLTGATGFLGGAVAQAAGEAGYDLRVLGRAEFSTSESLVAAVSAAAPDAVLHFAGTASVADSFAAPLRDFQDSPALWFQLLDAVRASPHRPLVVLASSAAVYGSPTELPTPETAIRRPESPYGFHKLLSEQIGEEFARCFGMSVLALRFFSVFGPRQRRLLVWEIFDQLRRGAAEIRLRGTGDERRDYLAVDEAAASTLGLAQAFCSAPPAFRAINLASGVSTSVREVAEQVRAGAGSAAEIVFGGEVLAGNPPRWEANIAALRMALPTWNPAPLAKSLAKCVAGWKSECAVSALR